MTREQSHPSVPFFVLLTGFQDDPHDQRRLILFFFVRLGNCAKILAIPFIGHEHWTSEVKSCDPVRDNDSHLLHDGTGTSGE